METETRIAEEGNALALGVMTLGSLTPYTCPECNGVLVQLKEGGLLRYLVSFRNHNEFHEQCVERIFMDIRQRCKPVRLTVYARYTRRGGLDINPFRTSHPSALPPNMRTARQ